MENPTTKKPFPWVWVAVGCGVISLCLLAVVAAAAIFIVIPAARTTLANQGPVVVAAPTNLPNLFPTLPALPTSQPDATPVPNQGSGGGTTVGDLPFQFSAIQDPTSLANQSLMDAMVSSLNLNTDTDFMAPKTYTGTATLDPGTPFTLGNGWCAKDAATLQQNMADMQFQLSINGTPIDLSKYPTLTMTDQQGHTCAMTGILVTPSGKLSGSYHVILTQKFLKSLDDGITSSPYPAGDVTFDFELQFRSSQLNPGTNS